VKTRFGFDSLQQARVVYSWLDYLVENMTKLADKGGNQEFALLGVLATQGIYESFSDSVAFLYKRIVTELIRTEYAGNTSTCAKTFNSSIEGLGDTVI